MTQQQEDLLNIQPTYGTADFSNAMVESIVHEKMQEFINQMGTIYQYPYEEESVNDKNCSHHISATTSANAVTMESIEQIFQKMLQDKNSKSNGRNKNKASLISTGYGVNGLHITYCWYHGITSNICHNRKSCKLQKEGHKLNTTHRNQMRRCI